MPIQGSYKRADETDIPEFKGLQDGGHNIIECSICKCPLVDIWITRPDEQSEWKVGVIDCPHCKDHSFATTITGGIHIGPTQYTKLADIKYEGKAVKIFVVKGKKYVRS